MTAIEPASKMVLSEVMVKETIPISITLTRLLATTAVRTVATLLEEAVVVPSMCIAYWLAVVESVDWSTMVKEVTEPVTLLEEEAAQASIPTIETWKLAELSLAMVKVTVDPETTQLLTRSEGTMVGRVPEEVKT